MGSCLSTINQRPRSESKDSIHALGVSDVDLGCTERERGNEEEHISGDYIPSSSGSAAHADEIEETVITSIRASDVALGLRRIPAGFYTVVQHSGLEWRTENKRSLVNSDVIEWEGLIPMPSDPSATVCLGVHGSFEFQPILGNGEQLRKLTVSVEQLLSHSAGAIPFTFFPDDGDVVSPCSSLLVTVTRWMRKSNDPSASGVLDSYCPITGCRGELESATDEGHIALLRYQKHGDKLDLERSIAQFECALNLCPLDHPFRVTAQSNVAMAKLVLCQADDTNISPDVPLTLYHETLSARPVDHPDRPSTLIHLAAVHFVRFKKRRDGSDAAQADAFLREAMDLSPVDSHESQAAMFMLLLHAGLDSVDVTPENDVDKSCRLHKSGNSLITRFRRHGEFNDLEEGIGRLSDALDLTSPGHPHKVSRLNDLGNAFGTRFQHLGDLNDLGRAISKLSDAIDLTVDGHPNKPCRLNYLGRLFNIRFHRLGELGDLERAISKLTDAVERTPHGHPHEVSHMDDLGISFGNRFQRLGDLSDLERAISGFETVVDLTPYDHPGKPRRLRVLGDLFLTRYDRCGELSNLEQAILKFENAFDLTPDGHPDKADYMVSLGRSFEARFQRLGKPSDLEKAISKQKDIVDLTPDGHPDKPCRLHNLGRSILSRFHRFWEFSDLEQAISRLSDAVGITPHGHPHKAGHQSTLGHAMRARFQRIGELSDLEKAISSQRDAVDITPDGDPDKAGYLNNLSLSLRARFDRLGDLNDLEQAISGLRDAATLIPDGHPDKPCCLHNLGGSLLARFGRLGEPSDLEEAISRLRKAVNLTPHGHPHEAGHRNDLGSSLRGRFHRFGDLSDLEQAISSYRDVVDLTLDRTLHGHPDRAGHLNNLGLSFSARFKRLGELSDIEQAISRLTDAVDITPDGDPLKASYLGNLGSSFRLRFERPGIPSDIEQAISRLTNAVDVTPDGDPHKAGHLIDLGVTFLIRFYRLGELSDVEHGISRLSDAVDLTPNDYPAKPCRLNDLGNSLLARFHRLGELNDLEQAISKLSTAVALTPHGHPHEPEHLTSLGDSFRARFDHLDEPSGLEHAIFLYSQAACSPTGTITARFQASKEWISCARNVGHHSLLHAYSIAISLIPQLAWIGLHLTQRYRELMQGADVVREAAAAALDSGLPETAVEWLEQGRSIVWGELFQLRSSYDELSAVDPDRARRLRQLSSSLEEASCTRERSLSSLSEQAQGAAESLEQVTNRHRSLAIERDKLLQEIRALPGFERFLLHKEFSQLRASVHSGPVVILNTAGSRCDALIVLPDVENVIHVPLPNFNLARSVDLQDRLKGLVRDAHVALRETREGKRIQEHDSQWASVLSALWKCVVKPVLDSLAVLTPGGLSRIFWCPTGPLTFLPIHAAGFYDTEHSEPGHKAFEFVVSSYVPTLSILAPPSQLDAVCNGDLRVLTVRQPPSDGLFQLHGVAAELAHIRTIIKNSSLTGVTLLESSLGTVEEVLDLMKEADWVHFACHGIQDIATPADSGLCLADGHRLKVSDIIALSRPRGGLAFLSACQTATGDKNLSDEAVHIAAGMLFAGYGGVVGTMWSISDRLAPDLAKDVYERLVGSNAQPNYRGAARALQDAVGHLRDNGASFVEWLPFIHVGL